MKKLIISAILALNLCANEIEIKLDTDLVIKDDIGRFHILCINGYKYLWFGGSQGSISQMFESGINGNSMPIKCK